MPNPVNDWYLYLLRTRNGALYTGIAKDVARRVTQHAAGAGAGAKSLRAKGPFTLVYQVPIGHHGHALRAELAVKKLPKVRKEALVAAQPDGPGLCMSLGLPIDVAPFAISE